MNVKTWQRAENVAGRPRERDVCCKIGLREGRLLSP
jgi:hypothetical protein